MRDSIVTLAWAIGMLVIGGLMSVTGAILQTAAQADEQLGIASANGLVTEVTTQQREHGKRMYTAYFYKVRFEAGPGRVIEPKTTWPETSQLYWVGDRALVRYSKDNPRDFELHILEPAPDLAPAFLTGVSIVLFGLAFLILLYNIATPRDRAQFFGALAHIRRGRDGAEKDKYRSLAMLAGLIALSSIGVVTVFCSLP